MAIDFLEDELTTLFTNDLKVSNVKNLKVKPIRSIDVSFLFTKIAGRAHDVQIFFDTGCNCVIFRDEIHQTQFKAALLMKGPI